MSPFDFLVHNLDPQYTKIQEPLAKYTTLKIGGPADIFFEAHSITELTSAIECARSQDIPVTIL